MFYSVKPIDVYRYKVFYMETLYKKRLPENSKKVGVLTLTYGTAVIVKVKKHPQPLDMWTFHLNATCLLGNSLAACHLSG